MNSNYKDFLAILRLQANLSQEELGIISGSSRSGVSRMESGESHPPFAGRTRKLVLELGQIVCLTPADTEHYLRVAGLDRNDLTQLELIQLGFAPLVVSGPEEEERLTQLELAYQHLLSELEQRERKIGISQAPPRLKAKIQEYKNALEEVQRRLDRLREPGERHLDILTLPKNSYFSEVLEGKIVVGHNYGESLNADIIQYSVRALASQNARDLMELADQERLAVDDCIVLTNSHGFAGWSPSEIKTTIVQTEIPIPDDLERLRQEKLPVIQRDYYNSSHYRLISHTPFFSDSAQLEIVLAPIHFHDYYSITPFFDEPLLQALDGSPISIRQKYGNTALSFSSVEKGTSLIPTPVSLQCVVLTKDKYFLLMRRSSTVAFYPDHWSASFEETMNAPGTNRKGEPSQTYDSNFFDGAIRGLDEEFAIPASAVEDIKVLSLNVEYLTLSTDVIMFIRVNMDGEDIRDNWMLKAADRDEASKFLLLSADLDSVITKLFNRTLWHPTARMRLIQALFHLYGVDAVSAALKDRKP